VTSLQPPAGVVLFHRNPAHFSRRVVSTGVHALWARMFQGRASTHRLHVPCQRTQLYRPGNPTTHFLPDAAACCIRIVRHRRVATRSRSPSRLTGNQHRLQPRCLPLTSLMFNSSQSSRWIHNRRHVDAQQSADTRHQPAPISNPPLSSMKLRSEKGGRQPDRPAGVVTLEHPPRLTSALWITVQPPPSKSIAQFVALDQTMTRPGTTSRRLKACGCKMKQHRRLPGMPSCQPSAIAQ
jgi:hypothetical protein